MVQEFFLYAPKLCASAPAVIHILKLRLKDEERHRAAILAFDKHREDESTAETPRRRDKLAVWEFSLGPGSSTYTVTPSHEALTKFRSVKPTR